MNSSEHSLLVGGSRSGKTFPIVRNIILRSIKKQSRHLIIRLRFNHAKASLWYDTIPKVFDLCFPGLEWSENKADWFITVPTVDGGKSQIWVGGIDDKDRTEKILGNEYSTIFANEVSQIGYDAITMLRTRLAENSGLALKFYYDCNPPGKKHWTYREFIEGTIPGTKEKSKLDTGHLFMNPKDNIENLPPNYIRLLESLPRRQRERFLYGMYLNDIDGALWDFDLIDKAKNQVYHGLESRVVIGVDPAVTSHSKSDEWGIIIASKREDQKSYVKFDLSGVYSPDKATNIVIQAYHDSNADAVVVETNQGGDMIETIFRQKGFLGKIIGVPSIKGKSLRAEPIQALYEQGLVAHNEDLENLENEMMTWVPDETVRSPNRIDAMVFALTELYGTAIWRPKYVPSVGRKRIGISMGGFLNS